MSRRTPPWPAWFLSLTTAAGAPLLEGCVTCEETSQRESFQYPVGADTVLLGDGSFLFRGRKYTSCDTFCRDTRAFVEVQSCTAPLVRNQQLLLECEGVGASCDDPLSFGSGRYTAGLSPGDAPHDMASYLHAMWHGERAAVTAFERLGRELAAHHAPADLITRCIASRNDERRHERMFRTLLRRAGVADLPTESRPVPLPVRSQAEMLIENLREGCFSEALGAWVLHVQASRARDVHLARSLRAIAADEAAHADLSLAIARAFSVHADASQVAAVHELLDAPANYPFAALGPDVRAEIGAPSEHEYAAMLRLFKTHVLAPLLDAPSAFGRAAAPVVAA